MKKVSLISLMVLVSFILSSCGSMIKLQRGSENLSYLKDAEKIQVKFDYSDMSVGEFADEEDYVAEKVQEKNKEEPGSGDEWRKKWYGQRESKLEPRFIEQLNYYTDNDEMKFSRDFSDTPYTVVVEVTFMEPGFNVAVVRKDAEINTKIKIYDDNDRSNPVSSFVANEIPGRSAMGYDFSVAARLGEAYAKCGKELGAYISDHM